MKALIIEDEELIAAELKSKIRSVADDIDIVDVLPSIKTAKRWFMQNAEPDLIFMDIQLNDGVSFEIFETYKISCPVIFTTAYDEYAIRAFKVNSIDYLLKPVDKKELKAALDKFHLLQSKFSNDVYLQQIGELFNNFNNGKKYKDRFTAHLGRNIVLINAADIACFSKEEVIYLVHKDGKKYITDYRSLDEVEELLDPAQFFRANRQFIIDLSYIETMRSDETGKVIVRLKLGGFSEIIVSKEKAAAFRKWVEG